MTRRARLASAPGRPAALAVVDLFADSKAEMDEGLVRLGLESLGVGEVVLRDLAGVDRGIASRWTDRFVQLNPHGGPAVVRELMDELRRHGFRIVQDVDPRLAYPEAGDEVEALALSALSRAASPLAVDLLLAQSERWRGRDISEPRTEEERARDVRLNRLIDPPVVAVVGPANVGKSTLVNALAGRELAIVADEPGTTRDHVGAMVDLAGLVVRWIDTPGWRDSASGAEEQAATLAREVVESADLVVAAGDVGSGDPRQGRGWPVDVVVALRVDLGQPGWAFDSTISVHTGEGVAGFVRLIRDRLVPRADIEDRTPWKFWSAPG